MRKYGVEYNNNFLTTKASSTTIPVSMKLSDGTVIRAGEDVKLFGIFSPISSIFSPVTSISNIQNSKYLTSFDLTFRKQLSIISIQDIAVLSDSFRIRDKGNDNAKIIRKYTFYSLWIYLLRHNLYRQSYT